MRCNQNRAEPENDNTLADNERVSERSAPSIFSILLVEQKIA